MVSCGPNRVVLQSCSWSNICPFASNFNKPLLWLTHWKWWPRLISKVFHEPSLIWLQELNQINSKKSANKPFFFYRRTPDWSFIVRLNFQSYIQSAAQCPNSSIIFVSWHRFDVLGLYSSAVQCRRIESITLHFDGLVQQLNAKMLWR